MKRLSTGIGILVVAAVAALATGLPGATASSSHKYAFTVVSVDAAGSVTPGDFFASPPVQNAQASIDAPVTRGGDTVGIAETVVTITRAGDDPTAMIECSVELPEGIVFFNGAAHLADVGTGATLPVTGGTGQYAGASGTVTMIGAADGSSTTLKFKFDTK